MQNGDMKSGDMLNKNMQNGNMQGGDMPNADLMWTTGEVKTILKTPVFSIETKKQTALAGPSGEYYAIRGKRCVCVVAETDGKFIMVRQFRHGTDSVTAEFPGGIVDDGETPEQAAARELEEESGYRAEKITLLGQINPNPALFERGSELNICVAEGLTATGKLHPDADEVLKSVLIPVRDVVDGFGTGELSHMFMGTVLLLYLRYKGKIAR